MSIGRRAHPAEDAAEMLGCKVSWLKEQARLRRIPFTLLGGRYCFTDQHLEQVIEIFEQQPKQEEQVTSTPRRRAETPPAGATPLRARRPRRAPAARKSA
jgi:hypothetical protein